MKKIAFVFVAAAGLVVFAGCRNSEAGRGVSASERKTFFGAFGDEKYVWENFEYGTNRVEKTEK